MRDLIDKRNQLSQYSQRLRTLKFDASAFNPKTNKEKITELINDQDKMYKKFVFYREYIKHINKERKR